MASMRGTHGLVAYRCRGRYYTELTRFESNLDILGLRVVKSIPSDSEEYKKWLRDKRAHYAQLEAEQDAGIFTMSADSPGQPWPSGFETVAILRPDMRVVGTTVIVNLDAEVLTMQFGAHFNLADFPHRSAQWLNAIKPSIYQEYPTLSLEFCAKEHMGEPAAARRKPQPFAQGLRHISVAAKRGLRSGRDVFLAHAAAKIYRTYYRAITRFGLEWERDSFVLREFVFALLSITAGEADFSSAVCARQYCFAREEDNCTSAHLDWQRPCFDNGQLGKLGPLAVFGSLYHRKGAAPGAAPSGHMYWIKGVAINISTVVDGQALQEAVDWGKAQGREEFQVIVISMFDVCFAEVHLDTNKKQTIRSSEPISLSPLRPEECMSLHPLTRPQWSLETGMTMTKGERIVGCNSFGTAARLECHYGGLAALVNFFRVALVRDTPPQSGSALPLEILTRIMTYTDNETQKKCMRVSQSLCMVGVEDFRVNEDWRIAGRPEAMKKGDLEGYDRGLLTLRLVHNETNEVATALQVMSTNGRGRWTWVPLIGSGERRVLMTDVALVFTKVVYHVRDEDNAGGNVAHLDFDDDANF